MKKRLKRAQAFTLALIIIFALSLNCAAFSFWSLLQPASAGYGTDWRCWSQGSSQYDAMSSGCRVVSYSKLLAECGIVSPESFNPDTLFEWGCSNGFWSFSSVSEKGTAGVAPVKYAASLGKTLVREGTAALNGTLEQEAQTIMSYINAGYFVVATCSAHYVYVGRAASVAAGTPVVMNSGSRSGDSASLIQQYASPPSGWSYDYTGIIYYSCSSAPSPADDTSTLEFGSYPQSLVTDSVTLANLGTAALHWSSYGYYSGSGSAGTMVQGDYMHYADTAYNGEKYRAVTFSAVRPAYTPSLCGQTHASGYLANTVYWFKYEPLTWRVLDKESGVMRCESIIDSQAYNNTVYGLSPFYGNAEQTVFANNYAASSVRQWLNSDFYNTAFSPEEKLMLSAADVTNTAADSAYSCAPTADYVFLLSRDEISGKPQASASEYARIQGVAADFPLLLRTAGNSSDSVCVLNADGNAAFARSYDTTQGICPAVRLTALPAVAVTIDAQLKGRQFTVGESALINYTVSPAGAKDYTAEFSSSDSSVIRVDGSTGAAVALKAGEAVLTVTVRNSSGSVITDTAAVTVKAPDAQSTLSFLAKLLSVLGELLLLLLNIFT